VRLGLLSTARINDAILAGAAESHAIDVVAVASRSGERAQAYAASKGIPNAHGSYEALLADDGVDAVYISLPNGLHAEWAVRCAEAGKHVLVEKPFSSRVAEVERAFDAAAAAGVVMSEAFMWRHHPQTFRLLSLIGEGAIGEVRLVRATFSFDLGRPEDPRWDPSLEGGSLMDVGTYCISGARLVLGEPTDVAGFGFGEAVDSRFAGVLRFADGALATFDCGFDLPNRDGLEVIGSEGTLYLADPWHARSPGVVVQRGDDVSQVEVETASSYRLELEDLAEAIATGRPPLLGRDDAVGQARVLEALLHPTGASPPAAGGGGS
jgi:D-xylose 1-dehydrogenase (NADP+, D-xylono-1,5-lactone-forming)